MQLFQALFLDFQIQQLAILKPVEVGKSYIPQKKALKRPIKETSFFSTRGCINLMPPLHLFHRDPKFKESYKESQSSNYT